METACDRELVQEQILMLDRHSLVLRSQLTDHWISSHMESNIINDGPSVDQISSGKGKKSVNNLMKPSFETQLMIED